VGQESLQQPLRNGRIVLAGKTYREWQDLDALGENMGQELRSKQRSERESVH
jgi:hypothetical protein